MFTTVSVVTPVTIPRYYNNNILNHIKSHIEGHRKVRRPTHLSKTPVWLPSSCLAV